MNGLKFYSATTFRLKILDVFRIKCCQKRKHVFASGSFTGPQNWGGVGWGGDVNVHCHLHTYVMLRHCTFFCNFHTYVMLRHFTFFCNFHTYVMLRHCTFTCTCAHMSCYVEDVLRHAWGGVGLSLWAGIGSIANSI